MIAAQAIADRKHNKRNTTRTHSIGVIRCMVGRGPRNGESFLINLQRSFLDSDGVRRAALGLTLPLGFRHMRVLEVGEA